MKTLTLYVLIIGLRIISADIISPISLSQVSFQDVSWDKDGYNLYSKQNISRITEAGNSLILYFFTAQTC